MTESQQHHVTIEINCLDESSQRELSAYRKLGSVRELAQMKRRELDRLERRMYLNKKLDQLLAGATFVGALVGILFMLAIFS